MIKTKTETIIEVDDWDELVKETYNKPYSFQQQDDCKVQQRVYLTVPNHEQDYKNTTVPEEVNHESMGVSFSAWLTRNPSQKLVDSKYEWETSMWWERNFYPHVSMIANDLHYKGLIDSGEYVINIDW